jgi:hypothetical protein
VPRRQKAGAQYLADAAPLTKADVTYNADVKKWNGIVSKSTRINVATPLVEAFETFQHAILVQTWPVNSQRAIKTLASSTSAIESDLRALSSTSPYFTDGGTVSAWGTTWMNDTTALVSAVALVRHDLGLPAQ